MYLLKSKKDHGKKKLIFFDILKATEEKGRIRIRIRNTAVPDPRSVSKRYGSGTLLGEGGFLT
jgi:hypothetical protein